MGLQVLLVDDSGVMRKMISRSLRQAGLNIDSITEAGNGVEGMTALGGGSFDIVLCDWNMPEMDGITFLREARKSSNVPFVMLTTEGTQDKINEAMNSGAHAYVTKPFTPEKLGERITVVLAEAA